MPGSSPKKKDVCELYRGSLTCHAHFRCQLERPSPHTVRPNASLPVSTRRRAAYGRTVPSAAEQHARSVFTVRFSQHPSVLCVFSKVSVGTNFRSQKACICRTIPRQAFKSPKTQMFRVRAASASALGLSPQHGQPPSMKAK